MIMKNMIGIHWNLEIQTVQGGNVKYDLHMYLGEDGSILPITEDDIYVPRNSPFKKKED